MNSDWLNKAVTVFKKEWRNDLRSSHGILVGLLFGVLAVTAMAFAAVNDRPSPTLAAGMLTVTLLFACVTIIPRIFIAEDEQNTIDLLRLIADPSAAFAGKLAYCWAQMTLATAVLVSLFILFVKIPVERPVFLMLAAIFSSVGFASGMAFCGALVIGASNRWILSSVIGMPLLLPQVILSILAMRFGFGAGRGSESTQVLIGLLCFSIALAGIGPALANSFWGLAVPTKVKNSGLK